MFNKQLPFGDKRLSRPFHQIIEGMAKQMTIVLRKLGSGKAQYESFLRFINNPRVTAESLVKQYWFDRPELDWSGKELLIYEDDTTISVRITPNRKDIPVVYNSEKMGGHKAHVTILVDCHTSALYGVGSVQAGIYEPKEAETKAEWRRNYWKTPFEDKETYRWYSSVVQTVQNCFGAKSYTVIADREADIYDLFARLQEQKLHWLIRIVDTRLVEVEQARVTLSQVLADTQVAFSLEVALKPTPHRIGRKAKLNVKYTKINLACPKVYLGKGMPSTLKNYVIEVIEDPATVPLGEKPVHWVLLTDHEVLDIETATKMIEWYRGRWNIEQLFRTIKKEGLNIETTEVESIHALINLTVLAVMAACRVMALVMGRNGDQKDLSTELVFTHAENECIEKINEKLEGKTEKQKNPHPPKTLAFSAWVIARLGGWNSTNKARPPGPITMFDGLARFHGIFEGFSLQV